MFAEPVTLLNAAASALTGGAVPIPQNGMDRPFMGVQVHGVFVGTVILEATIATQAAVDASTATWSPITSASWTAPAAVAVQAPFTHVRARVSAYTSGAISVKVN